MEEISKTEKRNNFILEVPVKTGTIGDTISIAFKGGIAAIREKATLYLAVGLIATALSMAAAYFVKQLGFYETFAELMQSSFNEVYGEFFGNYIFNNYLRMISGGVALLVVFFPIIYQLYKFIISAPVFAEIEKRGFIKWLLAVLVNSTVSFTLLYLAFLVSMAIFIFIIVLLFVTKNVFAIIIGVLLSIVCIVLFIAMILILSGVLIQISVLSVFRHIYPIKAVVLALRSSLSQSGSRSGGFLGGNIWHCVLFSVILSITMNVIGGMIGLIDFGSYFLVSATVPGLEYVTLGLYSFFNVILFAFNVFVMSTATVSYISENMLFGVYPLREELVKRAG